MLFLFMGFKIKDKRLKKTPSIIAQSIYYLTWCSLKDYEQTKEKNEMSFQVKGNIIILTLHTAPYNSRLTINLVVGAQ